jgi:hypothetical protein
VPGTRAALVSGQLPPTGDTIMIATVDTTSRIFQTSRRRSHALVVGILLVLGYFGIAAVLISDYSASHSRVERVA